MGIFDLRFSIFDLASSEWRGVVCLVGLLSIGLLEPGRALAYDYRVPILVSDEDDLEELRESGDITFDEKEQLLRMLERPLDLNRAARDRLYNLPGLTYSMVDAIIAERKREPFESVDDLERVEGITEEMIEQIEIFAKVAEKKKEKREKGATRWNLRIQAVDRIKDAGLTSSSPQDKNLPETYTRLRVRAGDGLEAGVAVVTSNTIEDARYNPDHPYSLEETKPVLETKGEAYLPPIPKAYGMLERESWRVIIGSYRVGFGQRAVFDTTGQVNPNGFEPDLFANASESSVTFPSSKNLMGVAATVGGTVLRATDVEATAFASYAFNDLYYTDVNHEYEGGFPGPDSYKVLTPSNDEGTYDDLWNSYPSIPRAYTEMLGGGNVTLELGGKSHVGVTGYAAQVDFQLEDESATFARSVAWPERKEVVAGGADFAFASDPVTVFGEAATMDNGSAAGVARAVVDWKGMEIEPSYRYLGDDFDNPHSSVKSQDELVDGNRDRGEHGARLSVRYKPAPWLALRADQDVWKATVWEEPEGDEIPDPGHDDEVKHYPMRMESAGRLDLYPTKQLSLGGLVSFLDKDIDESGRDEEFAVDGEKWRLGGWASAKLPIFMRLKAAYNISYVDEALINKYGKEHYGVVELHATPLGFANSRLEKLLTFSARGKYFEGSAESFGEPTNEKYAEGYLQIAGKPRSSLTVALRGAIRDHYEKANWRTGVMEEKPTEYFWRVVLDWEM